MDSDSVGDRLEKIQISENDNVENVRESKDENPPLQVPKILSPDLDDVFHIFVNMLDIKSFLKLAVTSKEMRQRCLPDKEDKRIKITLDVGILTSTNKDGSVEFDLYFEGMSTGQQKLYETIARKFPCKINVEKLDVLGFPGTPTVSMQSVLTKLKKIGVYKIDELKLIHVDKEWEALITIIKDFHVKTLILACPVDTDTLLSILQLNMEKLVYNLPVDPDLLLDIDTPIREIDFLEMGTTSYDRFITIFEKMVYDKLWRLNVRVKAVDLRRYPDIYEQEELPIKRPFALTHDGLRCTVKYRVVNDDIMKIFRCDPWETPYEKRLDEEVLKDLAEKHPTVCCSSEHFRTFFASFTTIDRSHKGPLPEARPLCFMLSENHFWMLDENENLMECSWKDDEARWDSLAPLSFAQKIEHPALVKCMFWTILRMVKGTGSYNTFYEGLEEFNSWFDGVKKLDFDYSGPLPKERPLVFERVAPSDILRVVLLDDGRVIECRYTRYVNIEDCYFLYRPSILLTARNIMDILKNPYCYDMSLNISFEVFRDGLELLKNSLLVLRKTLLISEKTETEIWFRTGDVVRKAVWENGRLSISHFPETPKTM